jgi:phosphatidylglycerophosphatase A
VVVLGVPGLLFSTQVERFEDGSDPSRVVIDEIVGQIFTLLWVPVSTFSLVAGFLLFRFFDIVKPFPARWSEKMPGGFGIFCDDLIAGVYAGITLKLLHLLNLDN